MARFADADLVSLYRAIVGQADAAGAEDRPGKGAAANNQSLVLKLSAGGNSALLAGDMQFAKPEISGLTPLMKDLRAAVKAAGPYQFIKFCHHASYNGFDASLLQEWSPASRYGHSGGLNDAGHPDSGVLHLLEQNRNRLQWARTDRNGLVTVTYAASGARLVPTIGTLNDATLNSDSVPAAAAPAPVSQPVVTAIRARTPGAEVAATAKIVMDPAPGRHVRDLRRPGPRDAGPQCGRDGTDAQHRDQADAAASASVRPETEVGRRTPPCPSSCSSRIGRVWRTTWG